MLQLTTVADRTRNAGRRFRMSSLQHAPVAFLWKRACVSRASSVLSRTPEYVAACRKLVIGVGQVKDLPAVLLLSVAAYRHHNVKLASLIHTRNGDDITGRRETRKYWFQIFRKTTAINNSLHRTPLQLSNIKKKKVSFFSDK